MIIRPKGYEYWIIGRGNKIGIRDDAPDWAKKEFEEYQEVMKQKADKNGVIKLRY